MYTLLFGYLFYIINPLNILLCLLPLVQYQYYTIYFNNQGVPNKLSTKVKFLNRVIHYQGRNQNMGPFFSWKAIGYIINTPMDTIIHLICRPSFYDDLMTEELNKMSDIVLPDKEHSAINVLVRRGAYKSIYYSNFRLDVGHLTPRESQVDIVSAISDYFCEHNRGVVFLSGVTGSGKTTIGYLLAKRLNITFCRTFNPSDPGDELSYLVNDGTPLILVVEEADVIIENIHHQRITKHEEVPITVYNKPTWNTFLDDISFYPILLIMTSNRSLDCINELDRSYLRPGRVNLTFSMNTVIQPQLTTTDQPQSPTEQS